VNDFTVWVDGDSCPVGLRKIIERSAAKRRIATVFVSDRELPITVTDYCSLVVVPPGDDAADDHIALSVESGDIVVTRDVTLTARVVASGAVAVDDRGNFYDESNVGERRSIHGFMSALRDRGVYAAERRTAGGKDPNAAFANAFDRLLTARCR
jgi:uncharacterized protein